MASQSSPNSDSASERACCAAASASRWRPCLWCCAALSFSASPLSADGKLYLFGEDGESVVGEPGKEWKKLAVNKLDDGCMATPAIAGKSLFIRTRTHLYRIEKKE